MRRSRCLIFIQLFFLCALAGAQNLYDINTIQDIRIWFSQSNWDYQMDTAKAGKQGYIISDSVFVNGVKFDSVGVKYKGNSSYNANNKKNPLHVSLDYIHGGQDYQGYEELKLGSGFKDPSSVREVLSYEILRNYMHEPLSNFAKVYINGTYYGLFSNTQSINKLFQSDHFYSSGNTFFKCNAKPTSSTNNPNLVYLGTDSASYYGRYEIQSSIKWKDLITMIDSLNNNFNNFHKIFDIDRGLWMLAFNNVMVNLDSYSGVFSHNYYLYYDDNKRFSPMIWDVNECFGGFTNSGAGNFTLSQMQNMTPLLHSTNTNRPLIMKCLNDARYKRMYIAHMRTINSEFIANNQYQTRAQALQSLISSAVQSDANSFYTYAQFQSSLNTTVNGTCGLVTLMGARGSYLNTTTEFQQVPPGISGILNTPANPNLMDTVWITAAITNANYAYLGYRYARPDIFSQTLMYDDGLHKDGAAADGVYGAYIIAAAPIIEYYLYADNANAGIFAPVRAEYEFYKITTSVASINPGDVVINEFMANNTSTVKAPNGLYEDWLELYNNTTNNIDLSGLFISDSYNFQNEWYLPNNAVIPANGYLIIWLDQDNVSSGYHASFKISSSGEQLMLYYANGTVIDSVSFGAQAADKSMQRCPNGTGGFASGISTFNSKNCVTAAADSSFDAFNIYPSPANTSLTIVSDKDFSKVEIYDMLGQKAEHFTMTASNTVSLNVSGLAQGVYFLRIDGNKGRKVVISR